MWDIEFSSVHTEFELLDRFPGEEVEHAVQKVSEKWRKDETGLRSKNKRIVSLRFRRNFAHPCIQMLSYLQEIRSIVN